MKLDKTQLIGMITVLLIGVSTMTHELIAQEMSIVHTRSEQLTFSPVWSDPFVSAWVNQNRTHGYIFGRSGCVWNWSSSVHEQRYMGLLPIAPIVAAAVVNDTSLMVIHDDRAALYSWPGAETTYWEREIPEVDKVEQDLTDTLVIHTRDEGVFMLDVQTTEFKSHPLVPDNATHVSINNGLRVWSDVNDDIWVADGDRKNLVSGGKEIIAVSADEGIIGYVSKQGAEYRIIIQFAFEEDSRILLDQTKRVAIYDIEVAGATFLLKKYKSTESWGESWGTYESFTRPGYPIPHGTGYATRYDGFGLHDEHVFALDSTVYLLTSSTGQSTYMLRQSWTPDFLYATRNSQSTISSVSGDRSGNAWVIGRVDNPNIHPRLHPWLDDGKVSGLFNDNFKGGQRKGGFLLPDGDRFTGVLAFGDKALVRNGYTWSIWDGTSTSPMDTIMGSNIWSGFIGTKRGIYAVDRFHKTYYSTDSLKTGVRIRPGMSGGTVGLDDRLYALTSASTNYACYDEENSWFLARVFRDENGTKISSYNSDGPYAHWWGFVLMTNRGRTAIANVYDLSVNLVKQYAVVHPIYGNVSIKITNTGPRYFYGTYKFLPPQGGTSSDTVGFFQTDLQSWRFTEIDLAANNNSRTVIDRSTLLTGTGKIIHFDDALTDVHESDDPSGQSRNKTTVKVVEVGDLLRWDHGVLEPHLLAWDLSGRKVEVSVESGNDGVSQIRFVHRGFYTVRATNGSSTVQGAVLVR